MTLEPMLAWRAKEAPANQKAAYFAVMAAFTNLALSASNLLTSYYNRIFVIERNDFSELGLLMIMVPVTGVVVPPLAVLFVNAWQAKVGGNREFFKRYYSRKMIRTVNS